MISNSQLPKLSIVTICYNAEEYILDTFNSIREQTNKKFEYIVIDGGSTDSTLELIKENEDIIDHWYSEPDDGIADAMNKGIAKSKGEYIVFLHADDYFVDHNSMARALDAVSCDKDIVVFDIFLETKEGRTLVHPRRFNFYTKFKLPFCHQGVICKRALFDKIGDFDTSYRITMDYDFFLRAYYSNASYKYVSAPLSVFRDTGISSRIDWLSLKERFSEEKRVHFKNCKTWRDKGGYLIWWCFYPLYLRFKYVIRHYKSIWL